MKMNKKSILTGLGVFIFLLLLVQFVSSSREGFQHQPRKSSPMQWNGKCKSGTEKIGLLCYDNCPSGWDKDNMRLSCIKK